MNTKHLPDTLQSQQPTRTQKTIDGYASRARLLLLQAAEHFRIPESQEIAPADALAYFEHKAQTWRPATMRSNRAYLVFWLEGLLEQNPGATQVTDTLARLQAFKAPRKKSELPKRTSAYKAKSIPVHDLVSLTEKLMSSSAEWARPTIRFLQAAVATGLRPCEWEHTIFLDPETLLVQNAKHTNGRGRGESRVVTIPQEHWLFEATHEHFRRLKVWLEAGQTYDHYYENCRHTLARAQKSLWPRRNTRTYTLYTGRHQWCANTKQAGASKLEIAEQMGHASEETAGTHYGRRSAGWSHMPAKALANGVAYKEVQAPAPASVPSTPEVLHADILKTSLRSSSDGPKKPSPTN